MFVLPLESCLPSNVCVKFRFAISIMILHPMECPISVILEKICYYMIRLLDGTLSSNKSILCLKIYALAFLNS